MLDLKYLKHLASKINASKLYDLSGNLHPFPAYAFVRDLLQDHQGDERNILQQKDNRNIFQYRISRDNIEAAESSPYSLSPVGSKSQKLLRSPRKVRTEIDLCRSKLIAMT